MNCFHMFENVMKLQDIKRHYFFLFHRIYAILVIKHDLVIILISAMLKTDGHAFCFQHFSRYLANVNERKIMFDLSN